MDSVFEQLPSAVANSERLTDKFLEAVKQYTERRQQPERTKEEK